jgi:fatty acid desaturase
MAQAARLNPKDFFTPAEWAGLSAHSSWKGVALIAHCWAVIGAAMVMAVVWPITIPLAVMIIGARQLGLAILMHDAAHGALHSNLKVNDWLAQTFCGGGVHAYRPYHLTHHRFAQQKEDPDLVLSAPFPITPLSLRRKVVRDLTGQTFFKLRFGGFVRRLKARKPGEPLAPIITTEAWRHRTLLIGGVVMSAGLAPFGLWWVWTVLWLLPKATWLPLVTRLRNIAEHACIAVDEPDPMRQARTTRASFVERLLIAPYYVNYHCEHHMFMHLPCYSLPRAHRLLARKGVTDRMEVRQGYATVLRMATSAGRPEPQTA